MGGIKRRDLPIMAYNVRNSVDFPSWMRIKNCQVRLLPQLHERPVRHSFRFLIEKAILRCDVKIIRHWQLFLLDELSEMKLDVKNKFPFVSRKLFTSYLVITGTIQLIDI